MERPNASNPEKLEVRFDRRAVSAGLPKLPRRENADAGDLPNSRSGLPRIPSCALPASFFPLECTVFPTDILRTGKRASLSRSGSQGIVVFPFILRKDALPLSSRP